MKKLLFATLTLTSLYTSAQKIKLEVGKTFKVTTTMVSTGEMMGQESSNNSTSISTIKITALEKDLYKGTNTLNKMQMTGSMMGQDLNFDSDKKADMDSKIGEMFGAGVNKSIGFTIDKNTGIQTEIASDKEEAGGGISSMFSGGATGNSNGFFLISALDKKLGDKWTETKDVDGLKITTNYEVQIATAGTITIATTSTKKGTISKDLGGQSVEMTVDSKSTGSLVVDAATGMLKKITTDEDATTNMDMGGQSMATTNKTKLTTVIE